MRPALTIGLWRIIFQLQAAQHNIKAFSNHFPILFKGLTQHLGSNPATYNTIAQQTTPTRRLKTLLNKEGVSQRVLGSTQEKSSTFKNNLFYISD
jgi:hypothetical protein